MEKKEKLIDDIIMTSSNYSNMHKRLTKRKICANGFLIYYSFFAIVIALIPKFFSIESTTESILSFVGLCSSILVLVFSLCVSISNYQKRIDNAIKALNALKSIKKKLQFSEKVNEDLLVSYTEKYESIVSEMELRTDEDFFRTCNNSKNRKELLKKYFTKAKKIECYMKIIVENLGYAVLAISPIIVVGYFFI